MTEAIRFRNAAENLSPSLNRGLYPVAMLLDAADEIEQLSAENAKLRLVIEKCLLATPD